VKARWTGHRLQAEIAIAVRPELSVVEAQAIATAVREQLHHHLSYLAEAAVCVEPFYSEQQVLDDSIARPFLSGYQHNLDKPFIIS
jgi:divalent metal cation (Fe/Co/Zn/Cd) transporter